MYGGVARKSGRADLWGRVKASSNYLTYLSQADERKDSLCSTHDPKESDGTVIFKGCMCCLYLEISSRNTEQVLYIQVKFDRAIFV